MRNLKKLLVVVITLAVLVAAVLFTLENQQTVSVFFLGFSGPQLPVSVLMAGSLLAGLAVGPLLVLALRLTKRSRRA